MTGPGQFRAWVDRSGSDRAKDPGAYLLAAAIGRAAIEQDIREAISRLRLPGQSKLHWRDEDEHRRVVITQAVAGCDLEHLVIVRSGAVTDRPERRRRKCLERLILELATRRVEDVVFESRGPADDRRDIQLLNALRGQRYICTGIRIRPWSAGSSRCCGSPTRSVGPWSATAPPPPPTRMRSGPDSP